MEPDQFTQGSGQALSHTPKADGSLVCYRRTRTDARGAYCYNGNPTEVRGINDHDVTAIVKDFILQQQSRGQDVSVFRGCSNLRQARTDPIIDGVWRHRMIWPAKVINSGDVAGYWGVPAMIICKKENK